MPPKAKKNDAQEAPAVTTVADGPLAALTPREQTIMLQCLLTVPGFPAGMKFDVEKVAQRMKLQNPRSVNNAWSVIKKKLIDFAEKDEKASGADTKAEEAGAQQDAEDDNPAPKKRARTGKAAAASIPKEATPAKPKEATTKPKATRRRTKKDNAVAPPATPATDPIKDDIEGGAEAIVDTIHVKGDADESGAESNVSDSVA